MVPNTLIKNYVKIINTHQNWGSELWISLESYAHLWHEEKCYVGRRSAHLIGLTCGWKT